MELKSRRQAKLSNFKGVDFSSSPLLVAQNRATNAKNFIYENGVNRKRNGWIEKFRVGEGNVNCIFECSLNKENMIIVYSGTRFYRITMNDGKYKDIEEITNTSSYETCKVNTSRLIDRRCQMFVNNNRVYIIGCGDYLTYGKYGDNYELRRVEDDEITSIPTTSINIDADSVENGNQESAQSPNLLTRKRKNTFVGNVSGSTYTVDAQNIDEDIEVLIEHETLDDNGMLATEVYKSIGSSIYKDSSMVGSIDFENGKITLNIDTKPVFETESNLIVTYGCKTEGYADRINNVEFGIMFGINGNPDRLFVAGNEEFPNTDFYSEMEDLTYFGDLSSATIGMSDSKIVAYSRLGDGTLAIHKEEVNGESAIFYRTGSYDVDIQDDGSIRNILYKFTHQAGTIGEGIVSKYANANLSGDKLYLSRNGVYGIVMSSNIASTERYSKERSQYIKDKLMRHTNLDDAVAVAFENRYYLALDNVCYIADARMTSQNSNDTNSFNYEWFYWDNMPVRVWSIISGDLYFGTKDGRICSFDDKFIDRTYEVTLDGDLMIDYETNKVIYNRYLGVKDNDLIKFSSDVFKLKLNPEQIIRVENNRIYLSETDIMTCYNATEIYVDNVGNSGLQVGVKYYIADVNLSDCSFKLVDEIGNEIEVLEGEFRICENLKDRELVVINLTIDDFQLRLSKKDIENVDLVKYNDSVEYQTPNAIFVIQENVVAEWFSPIFDFGTNQAMKVLHALTISTEPTTSGQIEFGYTTKNAEESIEAQGVHVFDFETLDFNNFSFDSSFANSYTVDIKDYFNFIQFYFKSDNEHSCAIYSLTVTYKINSINKGVQ